MDTNRRKLIAWAAPVIVAMTLPIDSFAHNSSGHPRGRDGPAVDDEAPRHHHQRHRAGGAGERSDR